MGLIFFFMSYTFSPHVAAREISIFPPFLLCVSSWASSLFTQEQKKSLRKVKGSGGPSSWPSMVFSCHFLSSIIVLPRNSSISLEIWWFFFLGNSPFREPILRSLCSTEQFCQNFPVDPDFLSTQILFTLFRPRGEYLHSFWWQGGGGELCWNLTLYVFFYWKS